MAELLGLCGDRQDRIALDKASRDIAARLDIEEWNTSFGETVKEYLTLVCASDYVELCCVDVMSDEAIAAAEETRKRFQSIKILLLAAAEVSPMRYIKPSIRAAALLVKPFTEEQVYRLLYELMSELLFDQAGQEDCFSLETKKTHIRVPYTQVDYFEARERRIYLCARGKQYAFYNTLESLVTQLPRNFLRCHKGYVINTQHIQSVDFSNNLVHLYGELQVPISRSYKNDLRELRR